MSAGFNWIDHHASNGNLETWDAAAGTLCSVLAVRPGARCYFNCTGAPNALASGSSSIIHI